MSFSHGSSVSIVEKSFLVSFPGQTTGMKTQEPNNNGKVTKAAKSQQKQRNRWKPLDIQKSVKQKRRSKERISESFEKFLK